MKCEAHFDTVFETFDHEILQHKLKYMESLAWNMTGLYHDKQVCRIDGTSSDVKGIDCEVPEGSCLGPLLFQIYTNDLPSSLQKSHVRTYADDLAISLSAKGIGGLQNNVNLDLLNAAYKQTFSECHENAVDHYRFWSKHS